MSRKDLHIGIIMQSPDVGGAETYMYALIKEFVRKGNSISLATNSRKFKELIGDNAYETDTIPYLIDIIGDWKGLVKAVVYLPLTIVFYSNLLNKYKKESVDVILMSNFGEKMLVTFLSIFFKIPVVWIEYGSLNPVFKKNFYLPKIIYRLLKNIPKFVIVPSKNTEKSLIEDARVSLAKLRVIPCGTAITHLKKKTNHTKKDMHDRFVIGNVSRMTSEKGQKVIIDAATEIVKKIPNAFFILIGNGPDKAYFESLIKKSKLEKYFMLPGFVESVEDYYLVMDIFIFPTIWDMEGFGVVTIEAMMRGIPVIGSDYGPVPEIIDNEKTGLLFPVGDSHKLANEVIKLAQDKKLRQEMGVKAKVKAQARYSIDMVSDQVLQVLRDATL